MPKRPRAPKKPKPARPPAPPKDLGVWSGVLRAPEAARPWPSLVFLSPFLALYTVGLLVLRPGVAATADLWLRRAMAPLGLTGELVSLGILTVILLAWHLFRKDPWRFRKELVGTMGVEMMLLVVPLVGLHGLFQAIAHCPITLSVVAGGPEVGADRLAPIVTSMGTGIYEELIFRLMLVSLLIVVAWHLVGLQGDGAIVAAVLVGAAIFAGAHTIGDARSFTWVTFLFRTAAGVYLSFLFAYRGFGIAAAVHFVFNVVIKAAAGGI